MAKTFYSARTAPAATIRTSFSPCLSPAVSPPNCRCHGRSRFLFARRLAARLRPYFSVGACLETLSRRTDHARSGSPISPIPASCKFPRENSNDFNPMWIGKTFISSPIAKGPVTLFAYDIDTQKVTREVENKNGFDFKSASAGPGGNRLRTVRRAAPLRSRHRTRTRRISVRVSGDLPQLSARTSKVAQARSSTPAFRPPARAPFLKRTARYSPCPPRKAICAISPTPPPWPIATRPGRPTENRSLIFPTNRANTRFTSAIRMAWATRQRSIWAIRLLLLLPPVGRPNRRKSPIPISN